MPHDSWGKPGVAQKDLVRLTGIAGLPVYVHKDIAVIHQYLADRLKLLRQKGASALSSDGGYCYRFIAGTKTMSNHSWALAVDYNAATNPYSRTGTTDFKIVETRLLCALLRGMRWGYDYSGKKDAMHFEWIGSRELAAQVTAMLKERTDVPSNNFSVGAKGVKVFEIKSRLNLLGFYGGTLDESFGEDLKAAVKNFQTANKLDADGIIGKDTLKAIEFASLRLSLSSSPQRFVDEFKEGWKLYPGDQIVSLNGRVGLVLQLDGNLVLYKDNVAVWQTGLRGNVLELQQDGNLVLSLVNGGRAIPVWSTSTGDKSMENYLAVQNDGNVAIYAKSVLWNTKSGG